MGRQLAQAPWQVRKLRVQVALTLLAKWATKVSSEDPKHEMQEAKNEGWSPGTFRGMTRATW